MSKRTFWLMLFIVISGAVLRLIFIDKPDGLWNDEYVSWAVASIPLGKNFINAVFAQCHMPFYYLYLKFFIHFFGNGDLLLRLTSVFAGVLSIVSMYFVGKEFKNEKLAILCASITALSSFLIYFSQEVRFYELLFFFASLSLLFTLKLGKKQGLLNFTGYIISNLLIIFTHTIGFIFVFFNLIFVSLWVYKTELQPTNDLLTPHPNPLSQGAREQLKTQNQPIIITWGLIFLLSLIGLPLVFKIFTTHSYSQWWGHFTVSKLGFLITDYFSPILTNIVSAPDNFFQVFSLGFLIFAILPSLIAIIGLVKALRVREYKILGLFCVCLAFLSVMIIAAITGKLMFITKYSIEIYPILIVLVCFGWLEFRKKQAVALISLFCLLNLFYLIVSPISAPKLRRSEGHKIVAELIKNADLKKGDFILLNYYSQDRFEKYFDFSQYNVISINKANFGQYLGMDSQTALSKDKETYKKVFAGFDNKYFDEKFKNEVTNSLKPNQKLAVVILKDVALYSPMQMHVITGNEQEYEKTPFLFLVFSHLRNQIMKESLKNLQILRIEEKGSWMVVTFAKK